MRFEPAAITAVTGKFNGALPGEFAGELAVAVVNYQCVSLIIENNWRSTEFIS